MRQRFQIDVQHSVGFTLEQLQAPASGFAFIGTREPAEVKYLGNGNVAYVYRNYWGAIQRGPCDVTLEVDPHNRAVVGAHSAGDGCFMPY